MPDRNHILGGNCLLTGVLFLLDRSAILLNGSHILLGRSAILFNERIILLGRIPVAQQLRNTCHSSRTKRWCVILTKEESCHHQ